MPVRRAEPSDLSQLVALAREYFESIGRPVDLDRTTRFFADHLERLETVACLFVSFGSDREQINGVIAGAVLPQIFQSEPAAYKTGWYARPGAKGNGIALLRAYESWTKSLGAQRIHANAREARTIKALEKLGYVPLELTYVKDV
jgi:hypothetical protein